MSLLFHPEAKAEEREAILWYGRKGPTLAGRLRDSLRATCDRIVQSPSQFPLAAAVCRQARTATFPYSTFFFELSGDIYVAAGAHPAASLMTGHTARCTSFLRRIPNELLLSMELIN